MAHRHVDSSSSTVELEIVELEDAMRENEEIDRRLLEQGHHLLETKARQQELMDAMASRIDAIYARWQQLQSREQYHMQHSFLLASENLPKCSRNMLSREQVDQLKARLQLVEDKVRLLREVDATGRTLHSRVGSNLQKMEQMAVKAQEVEVRLRRLHDSLSSQTNPRKEAKSVLEAVIGKLEKVDGGNESSKQLAGQLRQFLNRTCGGENSAASLLQNGEIPAQNSLQTVVAVDSFISAAELGQQQKKE